MLDTGPPGVALLASKRSLHAIAFWCELDVQAKRIVRTTAITTLITTHDDNPRSLIEHHAANRGVRIVSRHFHLFYSHCILGTRRSQENPSEGDGGLRQQNRYEDKVVCITGSSRGIGRQLALRFADEGADVVVHYFRNGQAAREVAEEITRQGRRVLVVKANLDDEAKIDAMFQDIEAAFGRLDVFIHNAASGRNRLAMEVDSKGWDWTQNVNARAFLLGAQRAERLMPPSGGVMLAISSFGSERVFPYYTSVGASKATLEALVRYLAVELGGRKINVNGISAGAIETDALKHFPEMDQTWAKMAEKLPYDRMLTTDDVANLALFLCSSEAEMIRGQIVKIDAGLSLIIP